MVRKHKRILRSPFYKKKRGKTIVVGNGKKDAKCGVYYFKYNGWSITLDKYLNGGYKIVARKGRKKIIDYEGVKKTVREAERLAKKWVDAYDGGDVLLLRKIGLVIT